MLREPSTHSKIIRSTHTNITPEFQATRASQYAIPGSLHLPIRATKFQPVCISQQSPTSVNLHPPTTTNTSRSAPLNNHQPPTPVKPKQSSRSDSNKNGCPVRRYRETDGVLHSVTVRTTTQTPPPLRRSTGCCCEQTLKQTIKRTRNKVALSTQSADYNNSKSRKEHILGYDHATSPKKLPPPCEQCFKLTI